MLRRNSYREGQILEPAGNSVTENLRQSEEDLEEAVMNEQVGNGKMVGGDQPPGRVL